MKMKWKRRLTLAAFGAIARYPLLCLLGENKNVFFSLAYSGEAFLLELAAQSYFPPTNKSGTKSCIYLAIVIGIPPSTLFWNT